MIMGMSPKTKAECDKAILQKTKQIADCKTHMAMMKAQYGANSAGVNHSKITLERLKGELAELKALRKTLK